jgi:hypothetical protein
MYVMLRESSKVLSSVDDEASDGFTRLGRAAYGLQPISVERFIKLGADPNLECSFAGGNTPLVLALAGYCEYCDAHSRGRRAVQCCVQCVQYLHEGGGSLVLPVALVLPKGRVEELVLASSSYVALKFFFRMLTSK